jgi:tetratricopeptide (TPR) repeat protein/predicted nucleic acid-binding protein
MSMLLEAFLIEIVGATLFETGRQGLVRLFSESPTQKAIQTTANEFPNIAVVNVSLAKWCKSEDFVSQIETLRAGYDQQADDRLINSFIDAGGFHDGITNTHASARRVLEAFFTHLEEELYKSDIGTIVEARRARIRHSATQAGINDLRQQLQQLPSDVEAVVERVISQHIPKFSSKDDPAVREKIHFANIDLAVELLKEGKASSARKRLQDLRAKLTTEPVSEDLRFRIAANLGSCALQLNDFNTAEQEYDAALSLKPEHRLVLSYAALTAMITGQTNRALEYARRSRPADEHDAQITSTYLRVLHHANLDDEISRLLSEEEWIERSAKCALALGLIRLSQQKYIEAEAYFKAALDDEIENPHVYSLLAQTIILPIDQMLQTNPPLQLSEETFARIAEAESHLTRAVEIFEKYENPPGLYESLLQRAYVRGLQGQPYAALSDCDRLLASYPNDAKALFQKGHTLLFAGRLDEALQCYSRIEDEEDRRASMLSIALAYHRAERHDKVIEILAANWRPADQTRRQLTVADLLLNAYQQTGDTERVNAVISDLERERAEDPDALAIIARHHMRSGKKEVALAQYKKAFGYSAPGNQRARISEELADYYFDVERWAAAAELYKATVEQPDNNPRTRKYLTSLYNSGARRAALDLAQRLRDGGEAIPFVSEIEARVLVAAGEFEQALQLFTQLAQLEPQKVAHRLWMVEMQHRLKNYEGARKVLKEITLKEVENDSHVLIQVAMLRQRLDIGGDLPFAYRARRVNFNDKIVHHAYVQLFREHTRRENGDLDVECVTVDSAVHFKDTKGEKRTYVIVEQDEYDLQQGEIAPTDPRAVEMLGKCTGHTVVFNRGRVDENQYEIVDVQSKYVYAFQQTIIKHTEWFGSSDAMMVMDVGDGDYSKFFRMIDAQQQRQRKTAELYRERQLPLAMVAWLKGANLFETWAALVNSDDMRLHMTTGDMMELQRSVEAIKGSDAIVVEVTALFTLCYLNLLDELPKVFNRIVVAQPVLDKLEEWVAEAQGRSPYMTIWEEQGQYIRQEITEEMIERSRGFLIRIGSFLERYAELLPALKALDIPSEQLDQYEEALGISASSVFVASELELPLYTDDVGLSQFAASAEWQVTGVSTLAVLAKMKSGGLLSAFDHGEALKALGLANYIVVHLTSKQLWWMCYGEGKKATRRMERILTLTLHGPEWEESSALKVAAEFTYRMWLEVSELGDRFQLLDFVIGALISGREAGRVKTLLKLELSRTFVHLPSALPLVFAHIDAFAPVGGVEQKAEAAGENEK